MKSFRGWTTRGRCPTAAAPMAIPVIAFSQFGMSNTRLPAKRWCAASVVPKMPRKSSTPIPATKMESSSSMHCTVASLIACQYLIRRMPSLLVSANGEVLDRRERGRLRLRDGRLHLVAELLLDSLQLVRRASPLRQHHGGGPLDRTARHPRLHLGARAVAIVVVPQGTDVLAPSVRRAFQERRATAGA